MTTSVLQPIGQREARSRTLAAPLLVSVLLAVVTAVAAAATFFVPGILRGTPVMNGSARGTALVMLVIAVPTLLAGAITGSRGSTRGVFAWLGATGYLTYNALVLLLCTPFNRVFPLYEAILSLSLATLWLLTAHLDRRDLAARLQRAPARARWLSTSGRSSSSTRRSGCAT